MYQVLPGINSQHTKPLGALLALPGPHTSAGGRGGHPEPPARAALPSPRPANGARPRREVCAATSLPVPVTSPPPPLLGLRTRRRRPPALSPPPSPGQRPLGGAAIAAGPRPPRPWAPGGRGRWQRLHGRLRAGPEHGTGRRGAPGRGRGRGRRVGLSWCELGWFGLVGFKLAWFSSLGLV